MTMKPRRGLAGLSPERRKAIARKGNAALRNSKKEHKFSEKEAKEARSGQTKQERNVTYSDSRLNKLHDITVKNFTHASNIGLPFLQVADAGILAVIDYLYNKGVGFEEFIKLVNREIKLILQKTPKDGKTI